MGRVRLLGLAGLLLALAEPALALAPAQAQAQAQAQTQASPPAAAPAPAPAEIVTRLFTTESGPVRGVVRGGSVDILGLPYARPPVGALRWTAPQPPAPWSDVREAASFGPACPQPIVGPLRVTAEDCLTINVSIPANTVPGAPLPVLFRVHGGGFIGGAGQFEHSTGVWNSEGIILVTFNYRLGPLGFLAHPLLQAESQGRAPAPANFGLLDIKAALEWTHRNIAAFGGDPANITLTGVSAGGEAVELLQLMPGTEGLYARAIASSGYAAWPLPRVRSQGEAQGDAMLRGAETLTQALGGTPPQSAAQIRDLDVASLLGTVKGFQLPAIDGVTVLDDPLALYAQGRNPPAPMMTGGNSYEGSVFASSGVTEDQVMALFGDRRGAVESLYADDFAVDRTRGTSRIFGDVRYVFSSAALAAQASRRDPVYLYYVTYVAPDRRATLAGSPHTGESQLLEWGGRTPASLAAGNPGPLMRSYWTNFIKTGDPNGPGLPLWAPTTPKTPQWMVFGDGAVLRGDVLKDKLDLMGQIFAPRLKSGPP
jgi:para-nitrobenzyl esterase